ncbi:MAG: hypothetical protein WC629_01380 [Candidatus Paceibacterota bacterium]|jgi:hypothetical protein
MKNLKLFKKNEQISKVNFSKRGWVGLAFLKIEPMKIVCFLNNFKF